jgi:hypothetical protein
VSTCRGWRVRCLSHTIGLARNPMGMPLQLRASCCNQLARRATGSVAVLCWHAQAGSKHLVVMLRDELQETTSQILFLLRRQTPAQACRYSVTFQVRSHSSCSMRWRKAPGLVLPLYVCQTGVLVPFSQTAALFLSVSTHRLHSPAPTEDHSCCNYVEFASTASTTY